MIWFALEAGLALALLIFIVWWTLPGKRREEGEVTSQAEALRLKNSGGRIQDSGDGTKGKALEDADGSGKPLH
jgi:hypothetical protein